VNQDKLFRELIRCIREWLHAERHPLHLHWGD